MARKPTGLHSVARVTQTCGLRGSFCCLGLFLVTASAAAEERGMKAELTCRAEAAPGRVLCELKYSAGSGARLVWADALVTAAPEFVRPLRSRVTPERFAAAAHYQLGQLLLQQENWPDAVKSFDVIVSKYPDAVG